MQSIGYDLEFKPLTFQTTQARIQRLNRLSHQLTRSSDIACDGKMYSKIKVKVPCGTKPLKQTVEEEFSIQDCRFL